MWILCNNHGKKLVYLKPLTPCRYGLTFLCIFWNSSGVLHDRILRMNLMVTPYAKYHKLTKVARNYCSHYGKTSENCGPMRLEEKARKLTVHLNFAKVFESARHQFLQAKQKFFGVDGVVS